MSKSLHNFVTVHDLLKTVDPQVLRFLMASVQYRRQINYSKENLQQAEIILQRFKNTLNNLEYRLSDQTSSVQAAALEEAIKKTKTAFITAMDDDFNVQNALAAIYDLLPVVNANIAAENADKEALKEVKQLLHDWLAVFGIETTQLTATTTAEDEDEITALIKEREQARKNKDWAKSDQLRAQLKEMGITVEDTPQGTRWIRE